MMNIVVPESILEAVEKAARRRELSVSEFVEQSLLAKATEGLIPPI
jgi:predicted HicB family RNase H-like nuclease